MYEHYRANFVYFGQDNENKPLYLTKEEAEIRLTKMFLLQGKLMQEGKGLPFKDVCANFVRFHIESKNREPVSPYKRSVDNFILDMTEKSPNSPLKDVFGNNRILSLEQEVRGNTKEFNRLKEYTRELEVKIENLLHQNKMINEMNADVTTLNEKITIKLLFQESVTKKLPLKNGSTTISEMSYETKLFRKEHNKQSILNYLVDNTFTNVKNLTILMKLNRSTIQKLLTQFESKKWVVSFKRGVKKGGFKVWGITESGAREVGREINKKLTQKMANRCQLPHTLLLQGGIMHLSRKKVFEEHTLYNKHINTAYGSFVPDMIISNKAIRFCIEAELNVKSKARYATIYRRYEHAITEKKITGVCYYFDSPKKRDRVLEIFKKLSRSYNNITEDNFNKCFKFFVSRV